MSDRGFRTGGIDGRMGPQTQAALVNFQRAEKLQPTGKLDRQTLAALGLQKGDGAASGAQSYGPATIRKVQETLNARGFKAGAANGILGETTGTALRAFQKLKASRSPAARTDRRSPLLASAQDRLPGADGSRSS